MLLVLCALKALAQRGSSTTEETHSGSLIVNVLICFFHVLLIYILYRIGTPIQ